MKIIFCPKCDKQITFDEKKYPDAKALVFVCRGCGHQFKIQVGHKKVMTQSGEVREQKEPGYIYGYIHVIENFFGTKQDFPLILGDNIIGRRNKDTDGVDVEIITSDPSMGRKHCIINVKENEDGTYNYFLRDFPSLTGTFVATRCLGKKERVKIEGGTVVTIGATTFILHEAGEKPEDENE